MKHNIKTKISSNITVPALVQKITEKRLLLKMIMMAWQIISIQKKGKYAWRIFISLTRHRLITDNKTNGMVSRELGGLWQIEEWGRGENVPICTFCKYQLESHSSTTSYMGWLVRVTPFTSPSFLQQLVFETWRFSNAEIHLWSGLTTSQQIFISIFSLQELFYLFISKDSDVQRSQSGASQD